MQRQNPLLLLAALSSLTESSMPSAAVAASATKDALFTGTDDEAAIIPSPRIIGGDKAAAGRYPFTVSLVDGFFGNHFCGGSLITPDAVLTAAHCLEGGVPFVKIGDETIAVKEEIVHPNYGDFYDYLKNDVALLKLGRESSHAPVLLNADPNVPNDTNTTTLTVMGLGVISESSGEFPDALLEVDVEWVPNEICDQATGTLRKKNRKKEDEVETYAGTIGDDMLCAASPGKDACYGDSGGPLIVKGPDASRDVQVGVVSWGYGCADESFPGVYANVQYQRNWIYSELCSSGED